MNQSFVHHSHWGAFEVDVAGDGTVAVRPHPVDPDPSPLLGNISSSLRHRARITQPMVRAGWLEHGPGPGTGRGADPFVPLSWERATELLAGELRRVIDRHGSEAIYGGSYGWASAGRFHHAQSQLHRFLNCLGGYTRSVNTYSTGASMVLLPHLVGPDVDAVRGLTSWDVIVENTTLLVAFGGIPLKNSGVAPGGVSRHFVGDRVAAAAAGGTEFVLFSPLRDDLPDVAAATWHSLVPGTDTAVMLALAFVLVTEDRHDQGFLDRYTVGFDRVRRHVLGEDGTPAKTPEWAEALSGVPAGEIRALARRMAVERTLITVTWSLQRAEHGEQPVWMGLTLAAMLGQIGLPGGGFGHGYGSMADVGQSTLGYRLPRFPQGRNPVPTFIPVARVADMLLHPGDEFDYNGERLRYPDTRLVYWAGGNPFHHHQDIPRLRRALSRPDTVVVHEPYWTSMARHADIVLPVTTTLERNDIGGAHRDPVLFAMQQAVAPVGQARNDYDIFSDVATHLGVRDAFTEGRDEAAWLEHMYETWRADMAGRQGTELPAFAEFWRRGHLELPRPQERAVFLAGFRADPEGAPLQTPSGRIEIFSETIHGFGYDDCPGHATWLEPTEGLGGAGRHPLALIANQPRTRLHSQLDVGEHSRSSKISGREPIRLHPADAAARGIADGDVVRVHNDRGACLAGAVLSDALRPGVVQLSTGAWYDPLDPADPDAMCVHGNPNMLTRDRGTSRLTQGCTGQRALVEVERFDGPLPPITAHDPPEPARSAGHERSAARRHARDRPGGAGEPREAR